MTLFKRGYQCEYYSLNRIHNCSWQSACRKGSCTSNRWSSKWWPAAYRLEDEVVIQDLSFEKDPILGFQNKLREMNPQIVGFTGYSSQSALVKDPGGTREET